MHYSASIRNENFAGFVILFCNERSGSDSPIRSGHRILVLLEKARC